MLAVRDDFEQTQSREYFQYTAARPQESQVAALAPDVNKRPNDCADARTVNLGQTCQVQQQLAHAVGNQLLQIVVQRCAVTTGERRSSMKIQYGDIGVFADKDLKSLTAPNGVFGV